MTLPSSRSTLKRPLDRMRKSTVGLLLCLSVVSVAFILGGPTKQSDAKSIVDLCKQDNDTTGLVQGVVVGVSKANVTLANGNNSCSTRLKTNEPLLRTLGARVEFVGQVKGTFTDVKSTPKEFLLALDTTNQGATTENAKGDAMSKGEVGAIRRAARQKGTAYRSVYDSASGRYLIYEFTVEVADTLQVGVPPTYHYLRSVSGARKVVKVVY